MLNSCGHLSCLEVIACESPTWKLHFIFHDKRFSILIGRNALEIILVRYQSWANSFHHSKASRQTSRELRKMKKFA